MMTIPNRALLCTCLATLLTLSACGKNDNNDTSNNATPAPTDMGSTPDSGDPEDAGRDLDVAPDMGGEDLGGEDAGTDMPAATTAQVQVLHLAAGAGTVDVYANDTLLIDDLDERAGTNFFDVPAGADLKIDVVAGDAADNSAPVYTTTLTGGVAPDSKTIIAALGDVTSSEAETSFRLLPIGGARTAGDVAAGTVSAMIVHGVYDAPAVDVVIEPGLAGQLAINDVPFAAYTANADATARYLDVDPSALTFGGVALADINVAASDAHVASFQTPNLAGLVGQSVVIAATGKLEDGSFGLTAFLATEDETPSVSAGLPLSAAARLQVVHNSADPAAAVVDVYGNGLRLIDDFAFRSATPFLTLPSSVELDLNLTAADAADDSAPAVDGPVVELDPGSTSIAVASGVIGASGDAAFALLLTPGQEGRSDESAIPVKIHHGSPDTPAVGVRAVGADAFLVESFTYGAFTDYLAIPQTTNVALEITNPEGGKNLPLLRTAQAIDFSAFSSPVVVMASGSSGLLPDIFSPGGVVAPLVLLAVFPDGTTVQLALEGVPL